MATGPFSWEKERNVALGPEGLSCPHPRDRAGGCFSCLWSLLAGGERAALWAQFQHFPLAFLGWGGLRTNSTYPISRPA